MNLMEQQQDYAPINPWISLATTDAVLPAIGDIEQAIPEVDTKKDNDVDDHAVKKKSSEASKEESSITCGPHASFWGYST